MFNIQQLCLKDASSPYTIKDLDNELICMAMVCSLGDEYSHFASSLVLFQSLEKEGLKEALLAEELQCKHHPKSSTASETILFASGTSCKCSPSISCSFCEYSNHCIWNKCQNLLKAKTNYFSWKSKHTKKGGNATNQASDASSSSQPFADAPSHHSNTLRIVAY